MKYLLPIFFLLFFAQQAEAQVPGYQGKQLYVSYDLIPHFFVPRLQEVYDLDGNIVETPVIVRFSNEGSINYAVSRTSILSVDFSSRKDGFATSQYGGPFFKTQSKIIGFGIKYMNFTRKGFIAPVGNFIQLRGFLLNTQATPHGEISYGDISTITTIPTGLTQTYNDFGMTVSWGLQTIWWDRLVPSYTIGLSYIMTNQTFQSWLGSNPTDERLIVGRSLGGALPGILFTGKIGIGVLLF